MSGRATRTALIGVAGLGAVLAGCGIRPTSVPVDAGAAPSQVACVQPDDEKTESRASQAQRNERLSTDRIYLVCGSRVAPVERQVVMERDDSASARLPVARKLLTELKRAPDATEGAAGFETAVPEELEISRGGEDDPREALRLNQPPSQLPGFALAQIVCTFADTAASDTEGGVTLGGPSGDGSGTPDDGAESGEDSSDGESDDKLRRYECDGELRADPEAANSSGTEL